MGELRGGMRQEQGFSRRWFLKGSAATGTLAAAEAVAGPFLRVARAQEGEGQLVALEQAVSPEPATATLALFTPENPGVFVNPTPNFVDRVILDKASLGNETVQVGVDISIEDPTNTPGNASAIILDNGRKEEKSNYKRLAFAHYGGWWRLVYFEAGQLVFDNVVLNDPARSGRFTLRMPQDGSSVTVELADGTARTFDLLSPFVTPENSTVNILAQVGPQQTLTLSRAQVSGFVLPPTPQPAEPQPVIPERPPAPIEPLFGQMPREVIGDLANDGFTVFNMGRQIRFNVKEIKTVEKAFREHALVFGREVQIALYDKPSDMPAIANPKPGSYPIVPRGCLSFYLDKPVEFYGIAVYAGDRVFVAFAPVEPLDAKRTLRETGEVITIREAYTQIFSQQIADRLPHTDPNPRSGVGCQRLYPEENAIIERGLFEVQSVQT